MNSIFKIFIFFSFALFSSCVEYGIQTNDLIQNKTTEIKYIIQGQIINRSSKHFVTIVRPVDIGKSIENSGVTGADVVVSDGDREFVYREIPAGSPFYKDHKLSSGIYVSQDYFHAEIGRTYTLNVTIGDKVYTASERMSEPDELSESEHYLLSTPGYSLYFGQDRTTMFLSDLGEKTSLYFYLKGNVNIFRRLRPEVAYSAYYGNWDQSYLTYLGDQDFVMSRLTFSEGYKDFLWSFWSQTDCSGDRPFSTEPGNVKSNFNSSEIGGYFAAISRKCYNTPSGKEYPISVYKTKKIFISEYNDKGRFKITFDPTGQCILEGMGKIMKGAYDIRRLNFLRSTISNDPYMYTYLYKKSSSTEMYDGSSIVTYFSSGYKYSCPELYKFYCTKIAMLVSSGLCVPKLKHQNYTSFIDLTEGHVTSFNEQQWIAE